MIVTTSRRHTGLQETMAVKIANELKAAYVNRNCRNLHQLVKDESESHVIVVGKRIEYFADPDNPPFFFHPSMGFVRAKRVLAGEQDPLLTVCDLKPGDQVLDATLGLGADALLIALAAGESGKVTACESNPITGLLVKYGLQTLNTELDEFNQAAARIDIQLQDHHLFLKNCPDRSFDIIYFDPMFRKTVEQSPGIEGLKFVSDHRPLKEETIQEAKRVARKRIVLKERGGSGEFERLQFRIVTPKRKIQFGVIEIDE